MKSFSRFPGELGCSAAEFVRESLARNLRYVRKVELPAKAKVKRDAYS